MVKSAVTGISSASGEINKLYIELADKQNVISNKANELINKTNALDTLILSNKIHSIFTALLTQYAYETTTISAIITAARLGLLHPNLMTPRELSKHLIEIKLQLPINLNLPMGTDPKDIYELSKIAKMAVFYENKQIVFIMKIPLITELELTLYKILPIPQPIETNIDGIIDRNHSIILKPEFQYVAITKNRKQYTTFTETQLLHCTETEIFTICPEFSPITHEGSKNPCEIALFKNPDILPKTCEAGVIILTKNIFYKLKYANAWIYTTKNETLTISCEGNIEPFILKIAGQGVISLNEECRAYGSDITLNPSRDIKTKYYANFIPQIGESNLIMDIPDKIRNINLPKLLIKEDSHKLDKIHEMAHSLDEVQKNINNEIERQEGQALIKNKDNILLYFTLGLLIVSIMLMIFIYITYKCNLSTWKREPNRQPRAQPHYERVERGGTRFYKETPIDEVTSSHEMKDMQDRALPPTLK